MMQLLKIGLRQHTPLLHFQGEQDYATLRASEVKPRLDKYIIEHEFGDDYTRCRKFLVGYDPENPDSLLGRFTDEGYRALNYKMKILATDIEILQKVGNQKDAPMYFGYMGDRNDKWLTKSSELEMEIRIPGDNGGLKDIILKHIGTMFANTNFGTRKTKGYGSFTVISPDNAVKGIRRPALSFTSEKEGFKQVMEEIEWVSKALRGGINDCYGKNRLYFKSLMFAYARYARGEQWDKRSIKREFLDSRELANQANKYDNDDIVSFDSQAPHYDYRDCLGLSSDENWMSYNMKLKKNSSTADRMASPILFKPVRYNNHWTVYIVWDELPEKFKRGSVQIDATIGRERKSMKLGIDQGFSIRDYIEFVFGKDSSGEYHIDIEGLFGSNPTNLNKKDRIISIFEELRNNYNQ